MDYYEDEYEPEIESDEEETNIIPDQFFENRCRGLYDLYHRVIRPHQEALGKLYIPCVMDSLTPEAFVQYYLDN